MSRKRKAQHDVLLDDDDGSQNFEEYQEDAADENTAFRSCHYCFKDFPTSKKRMNHEKYCKSGTVERFTCKVCGLNFRLAQGLERHEKRHEPPGGFLCAMCDERFTMENERTHHRNTEHKVYRCQICEAKYATEAEYVAHIVNKHGGKDREPVVCPDCGQQFRSSAQLKLHNKSKCGTVKMYACDECNSRFMTSNTLKAHKLIHIGEKKHLCNYCGNSFLSKGQLKVHERSHTGEKPFKCQECGKAFAYRESLVTHQTLHTGVRPYVCELCGSRFSCIGNLIKHRRSRPDTCGLPQFRRNSKVTPRTKTRSRGKLTKKLEKLVEKNEISIVHQLHFIDAHDNVPIKVEKNDVEVFSGDAAGQESFSAAFIPKIEDASNEIPPAVTEVLIHNAQEAEDLEDDVPLSHLRTQTISKDDQQFVLTEVEIVPRVTKKLPERRPRETKQTQAKRTSTKRTAKQEKEIEKEAPEHDSNNISFLDVDDFPEASDDDGTNDADAAEPFDESLQYDESDESEEFEEAEEKEQTIQVEDQDWEPKEAKKRKVADKTSMVHEYKCDKCPKMFCYKTIYNLHLKREHGVAVNDEDLPNQPRYSKILFPRDRVHECRFCKRKYANKPALLKHEENHGPEGNLHVKCLVCKEYFENEEKEKEHRLEKHKDRITCKMCFKLYRDEQHLQTHIKNCHTKVGIKKTTHLCGKCGKSFTSKTAMMDHERSDCGKSPIYQCEDCKKFYHSAGSLKTHRQIHTGEFPNLCKYCGKGFRTPGQLKVHERIHTGEKPFQCSYCPKSFSHRESLLTHISLHTGFKRFQCSGCGQRFTCISNLQAHRKAHADTCGLVPNCTKAVGRIVDAQTKLPKKEMQEVKME